MDWHGESFALDTACSSALTAIHRTYEHPRSGPNGEAGNPCSPRRHGASTPKRHRCWAGRQRCTGSAARTPVMCERAQCRNGSRITGLTTACVVVGDVSGWERSERARRAPAR
ncbi:beta-ketoacyl synthase N-terminal-like domain-containing protein [Streptomyces sp. NPDC040750]|uniref:beta-ketoacyl synthase N-terminal-like domain-containing protein n=1 Tax=Streptomyces sp. NPDC040750 TaxID=3154491 RepID=UPI0033C3B533